MAEINTSEPRKPLLERIQEVLGSTYSIVFISLLPLIGFFFFMQSGQSL